MTKDSFNRKKNYSNTKIIQLDPLGERLSNVGMTGGASARKSKSSDIKIITVKPLIILPLYICPPPGIIDAKNAFFGFFIFVESETSPKRGIIITSIRLLFFIININFL